MFSSERHSYLRGRIRLRRHQRLDDGTPDEVYWSTLGVKDAM